MGNEGSGVGGGCRGLWLIVINWLNGTQKDVSTAIGGRMCSVCGPSQPWELTGKEILLGFWLFLRGKQNDEENTEMKGTSKIVLPSQ